MALKKTMQAQSDEILLKTDESPFLNWNEQSLYLSSYVRS
jgi:hypothetical protein